MKRLSFLLLGIFISLSAIAYDFNDFKVDNICYNIISKTDKTVSVTYTDYQTEAYHGDVVIPAQVTYNDATYTVTKIGDSAFRFCKYVDSVTLPNTVTEIDDYAFEGCVNMASFTASNSLKRIRYKAFNNCLTLPVINNCRYAGTILTEVIDKNATSINIQQGTRYLAQDTFRECPNLTSITIPNSVVLIDANTFYNCPNLESVTLSENLEKIGSDAFSSCKKLPSMHITRNVNEIDIDAFRNCDALNSITVDPGNSFYDSRSNCNSIIETESGMLIAGCKTSTIPNSVISLRDHAFYGCIGLKSIAIPKSLSAIGTDVFFGCYNLESITVDSTNRNFDSRNNCNAIIETATDALIRGCNNSVIPDGIKVICDNAFYNCNQLATVNFSTGLTSIGKKAFYKCAAITDVVFPNTLITIGENAFNGCVLVKSLVIPNSVTKIGADAFKDLTNLERLTIGNGLTEFNDNTFAGSENIKFLSLDSQVIVEQDYENYWREMTALFGTNVEEVIIGDSVTKIGKVAFADFYNLQTVKFGKNIKTIGAAAFANTNITEAILPEGLTSIGSNAFEICPSLKSIWIPKTCTSIGGYAFIVTPSAESIIIEEGNPVYDSRDNCNAIIDSSTNHLIRGGMSSTIPNTVTSIDGMAFYYCYNLKSIKIPDSVTIIGEMAFNKCTGLEYVEIGKNVQEIGYGAFECINEETYENEGNINTVKINSQALVGKTYELTYGQYYNVANLFSNQPVKTFIIGDDVTSIGENAFTGGSNLTSVTIGENIKSIGNSAFMGCDGLETVELPNSVETIGDEAFYKCSSLRGATIGTGAKTIGARAFLDTALEGLRVEAVVPPVCNGDIVSDDAYSTVYLETLNDSYATADIWKKFTNFHPTAVDKINTNATDVVPVVYYDLNGVQYTEPQQGINIVRYSDGSVKKITVK